MGVIFHTKILRGSKATIQAGLNTLTTAGVTIYNVNINALAANYYVVSVGYNSQDGGQTATVIDGDLKTVAGLLETAALAGATDIVLASDCLEDAQPGIDISATPGPISFMAAIIVMGP